MSLCRAFFSIFLVLSISLTITGCSRGAQAEAQGEPVVAEATAAAETGPARMAMAPHLGPAVQGVLPASHESQPVTNEPTVSPGRPLPDRLVMPALDMDIPVEEIGWSLRAGANGSVYNQWDEADYAAGWHKNSAIPGERGNVVLSGHNNIMGAVFRELDQLSRGDIATLYVDGVPYDYAVDRILIVPETTATPEQRRENAKWIQPTTNEQLTLVSCWPRDNNTHRIIVLASPVAN